VQFLFVRGKGRQKKLTPGFRFKLLLPENQGLKGLFFTKETWLGFDLKFSIIIEKPYFCSPNL
jgi:hypothetical protein